MQFKPAPENLISKERVGGGGSGDETVPSEEADERMSAYIPPRVVAMPYNREKRLIRSMPKSRLEKSKLIRELRDEITDFPAEVQVISH